MPVSRELMENLRRLRAARRRGGCSAGCRYGRTDDSRLPWDAGGRYGGWGGHAYHGTDPGIERTPVVFVHGNQRDACDWERHAEFFLKRSYGEDALWAVTFEDGSPTHPEMAEQLEAFVGPAGANHGTVLSAWAASAGLTRGTYRMSPFLRADYESDGDHPLARLNEGETPGDVDYYTVRGTEDPLFWRCADSPALEGAEENVVLPVDHGGVRTDRRSKELVFEWLSGTHPHDLRYQVGLPD